MEDSNFKNVLGKLSSDQLSRVISFVGNAGCGKTFLIRNLISGEYDEHGLPLGSKLGTPCTEGVHCFPCKKSFQNPTIVLDTQGINAIRGQKKSEAEKYEGKNEGITSKGSLVCDYFSQHDVVNELTIFLVAFRDIEYCQIPFDF
jgi:GTPase SAR1 family protein